MEGDEWGLVNIKEGNEEGWWDEKERVKCLVEPDAARSGVGEVYDFMIYLLLRAMSMVQAPLHNRAPLVLFYWKFLLLVKDFLYL